VKPAPIANPPAQPLPAPAGEIARTIRLYVASRSTIRTDPTTSPPIRVNIIYPGSTGYNSFFDFPHNLQSLYFCKNGKGEDISDINRENVPCNTRTVDCSNQESTNPPNDRHLITKLQHILCCRREHKSPEILLCI
jgi:hypothetical protein